MSTKRKIEDYKDQKVAIHCSTKEEWDKIVDVLPSGRSVKKKLLAAEGEVKQAEIAVSVAKQALEDSKASKPFNVQNILNKRTAYLQAEEDLKTQQETATQIKDSHTFLVQLAEELF